MQRGQFNLQQRNIGPFSKPTVDNAQCIIGSEKNQMQE